MTASALPHSSTLSRPEWLIIAGSLAVWALIVAGGHVFVPREVMTWRFN